MAATETSTTPGPCPSDEELAAFLDGTLPRAERARITAHLADCESCYEIFAGAVDFQQDSELVDQEGTVVPFPSTKDGGLPARKRWWIPAAAAAMLAVGLGFTGYWLFGESKMETAALVASLGGQPGLEKLLFRDVYRGGNKEEAGSFSQRPSFMVGVHLLDLRLSDDAGKAADASEKVRQIGAQVKKVPLMNDFASDCFRIADAIKPGSPPEALHRIVAPVLAREAELDESLPPSFAFGKWAEAGRLAAETHSPVFFSTRNNRRFMADLLKHPQSVEEGVLEPLQAIATLWDRGDLRATDYKQLADHFREIIRQYDL